MTGQQIFLSKNLQAKFYKEIKKISHNTSTPYQKFLKDITFGIIKSKSCIIRRTSQGLQESISLKKTQKRLTYHLDNQKEIKKVEENLLISNCQKLQKESLILVDPTDIVKSKAEKMEGLSKVRDGNDGKYKNGYDVIDIVGVEKVSNTPSIFPIYSELHSEKLSVDTLKSKILDKILDIIIYSNNSGIFVMDRGFDDKRVIGELYEYGTSFIIRMKNNRTVFYNGKEYIISKLGKAIKKKHIFTSGKTTIKAGICEIGIPLSGHKIKNPPLAKVKLISADLITIGKKGKKREGSILLIASLSNSDYSELEICEFVLRAYRLRWKIEEVHRQVKVDFGWEEIQLLRFHRLEAMNTILWLVLSFIYELDDWKHLFADSFPNLMLDKKNDLSILNKFIYYRITKVVTYCFSLVKKYAKNIIKKNKQKDIQLCLQLD